LDCGDVVMFLNIYIYDGLYGGLVRCTCFFFCWQRKFFRL